MVHTVTCFVCCVFSINSSLIVFALVNIPPRQENVTTDCRYKACVYAPSATRVHVRKRMLQPMQACAPCTDLDTETARGTCLGARVRARMRAEVDARRLLALTFNAQTAANKRPPNGCDARIVITTIKAIKFTCILRYLIVVNVPESVFICRDTYGTLCDGCRFEFN